MSKIAELKSNPQFPGLLHEILAEFDARLAALEVHAPLLADAAERRAQVERADREYEEWRAAQRIAEKPPVDETKPPVDETIPPVGDDAGASDETKTD